MSFNNTEKVDIIKIVEEVDSQVADIQALEDKVTAAIEKAQNANNAASYANRDIGVFKKILGGSRLLFWVLITANHIPNNPLPGGVMCGFKNYTIETLIFHLVDF